MTLRVVLSQTLSSPKPTKSKPVLETKLSSSKSAVEVAGVALSHPDRVYWDDAGVTKQMLAEYYESVWKHMAPHVTSRVLALVRDVAGVTRAARR